MLMRHLNGNTIIIGHAVHQDLKALKISHHRIIDTTEVFRETLISQGKRSNVYQFRIYTDFQLIYINNPNFCERKPAPKLKVLAKKYLNKDIQTGNRKHNPVVDALTCIQLMQNKIKSEKDRHMIYKILTKEKFEIVCVELYLQIQSSDNT